MKDKQTTGISDKLPGNGPTMHKLSDIFRNNASKTPIPLAGLMLGLSSAGSMIPEYYWFFGYSAFIIQAILIKKILFDWKTIRNELKNPAVTGIACTFPMAVAVLSTYFRPYQCNLALAT